MHEEHVWVRARIRAVSNMLKGRKKVFGGLYMPYYYSEEVKLLLVEQSDEKVELLYDSNPNTFELPLIGPRPPYYYNPRFVPYYPVI